MPSAANSIRTTRWTSDEMPPLLESIARGEHVPSFQTVRITKTGTERLHHYPRKMVVLADR